MDTLKLILKSLFQLPLYATIAMAINQTFSGWKDFYIDQRGAIEYAVCILVLFVIQLIINIRKRSKEDKEKATIQSPSHNTGNLL